jgi:hypothetical protein
VGRQRRQWSTPRIIRPLQAILDHLPQRLPLQDLPQRLPLQDLPQRLPLQDLPQRLQDRHHQDLAHQVALVVQDRRHQVAAAAVAVVEVLHIVIGQAIRPVPVSVPKLVRTPLGLLVLLVTARLFVVHIILQQEHPPLLPSQALPLKKGILQQAQSVITPHPTRQMLHIAINQPIRLAIVWALRMAKAIQEPDVLTITA